MTQGVGRNEACPFRLSALRDTFVTWPDLLEGLKRFLVS
jgi:hypothetical protein